MEIILKDRGKILYQESIPKMIEEIIEGREDPDAWNDLSIFSQSREIVSWIEDDLLEYLEDDLLEYLEEFLEKRSKENPS